MAGKDVGSRVSALLEIESARHGLELVAVEVVGSHRPTIRVFLDREGGIDIDAIAAANRWISATLDADDPVKGAYTLEVSSPGIERPLVKIADFERHIGAEAHVKTGVPIDGRSKFTGTITEVDGDTVVLTDEKGTYKLPHAAIAKARLKVEVGL